MEEKKTFGQKVKSHLKKHKGKYIAGGIGLGVGIVIAKGSGRVANIIGVNINSPITTQVHLTRRGHPGNIIKCNETGELFASQNRAAQLMGINPGTLSSHLKGKMSNAGGYTFEKVGEACS